MNILLITATPGDKLATRSSALLQEAFTSLQQQHPGHRWITMAGNPVPGMFLFVQRNKYLRDIRQHNPSIVLYASVNNMLRIKDVPVAVFVNDGSNKNVSEKTDNIARFSSSILLNLASHPFIAPIDYNERLLIHEKFTAGREYFFYSGHVGPDGTWEKALQAFSAFRKWQQSHLQLVMGGSVQPSYQTIFEEKLDAYKHKHEIIRADHLTEKEKEQLAAAAFACLVAGQTFEDRLQTLHAFRSGVPVIGEKHPLMEELAGGAMLYAEWNKSNSLSQQLINLYKDERLYNQLIEKGKAVAEQFSLQQGLQQLYSSLMELSKQL